MGFHQTAWFSALVIVLSHFPHTEPKACRGWRGRSRRPPLLPSPGRNPAVGTEGCLSPAPKVDVREIWDLTCYSADGWPQRDCLSLHRCLEQGAKQQKGSGTLGRRSRPPDHSEQWSSAGAGGRLSMWDWAQKHHVTQSVCIEGLN